MATSADTERRKVNRAQLFARLSISNNKPSNEPRVPARHSTPDNSTNDIGDLQIADLFRRTRTEPFVSPLVPPEDGQRPPKKKTSILGTHILTRSLSRTNSKSSDVPVNDVCLDGLC